MSLVVGMGTPRRHKHAVFLAIFPTLLLGFDGVSVARLAVMKEPSA
jgi:hypothetical protein